MSMPDLWVVTDHPKDFPEFFVARRWVNGQPTGAAMMDRSLEDLRRTLAAYGLTRIPRDESDDPVIVESWVLTDGGWEQPVWKHVTCPRCNGDVPVYILSLTARCGVCGTYYSDTETRRGWYDSREAYEQMKARIAP